jgi:hypothetical protein
MTPPGGSGWFDAALLDRIFYRLGGARKLPRPRTVERRRW